jgi:GMP synthase (glutamine-hydrolysing)
LKQLLVVNLYLESKYKRNFDKLVTRVKEVAANTVESDFESLAKMAPDDVNQTYSGVILSGTEALWTKTADRARFVDLIQFLPKITIPVLGICGGHQALALAYGGTVAKGRSGLVQGFRTVSLEDKDTLLAGLPAKIRVMQSHKEEVKSLPPGFVRTATSSDTDNECMKHNEHPLYGIQFYPERWNEENQAGKIILENFVHKIALQESPKTPS